MDKQTNERMDGQRFPLCSTGLRPLWGRCPASTQNHLNKYINQFVNKQGKGIADHILPLGDLFQVEFLNNTAFFEGATFKTGVFTAFYSIFFQMRQMKDFMLIRFHFTLP